MERNASVSDQQWNCCYQKLPKSQFAFFAQVISIYILIIAAIVNISLETPEKTYWFYILGSVTGVLLPSPTLKKNKAFIKAGAEAPPITPPITHSNHIGELRGSIV